MSLVRPLNERPFLQTGIAFVVLATVAVFIATHRVPSEPEPVQEPSDPCVLVSGAGGALLYRCTFEDVVCFVNGTPGGGGVSCLLVPVQETYRRTT